MRFYGGKDLQQICVTVGCPLPNSCYGGLCVQRGCINIMLLERLMKIRFTATIMFYVLGTHGLLLSLSD